MITDEQLEHWFKYHSPREGQQRRYVAIREAGKHFARTIVENSEASPDQTAAIRKIREAIMTANQGIACEPEETSKKYVVAPD